MSMKARELATGKWRSVLTQLGVPESSLDGKHHPCPSSGQGEDRFRFADRNGSGNYFCDCSQGEKGGMGLLMCCRGLGYAEAAREVERVVGAAKQDEKKPQRDPRIALNATRRKLSAPGSAVIEYLHGRGLDVAPALKQARLDYWASGERIGEYDCMVALVSGADGKPQSYHVTYLVAGKKADVDSPRKIMTPVETVTGGAIRLYPPAEEMGVAEGIETAIAASMLFRMPVWAAINSGCLAAFAPPADCKHLTVFGDNDANYTGQSAAYSLAHRMAKAGRECVVLLPPEQGDWNDVLIRKRETQLENAA